jgi:hypothetical protein
MQDSRGRNPSVEERFESPPTHIACATGNLTGRFDAACLACRRSKCLPRAIRGSTTDRSKTCGSRSSTLNPMTRITLFGCVGPDGFGNASKTWPIKAIRRTVAAPNLLAGTLNLDLFQRHVFHADFTLAKDAFDNTMGKQIDFQSCRLIVPTGSVNAFIAHIDGSVHSVVWNMEIMAEEHLRNTYGFKWNDRVTIEVFGP